MQGPVPGKENSMEKDMTRCGEEFPERYGPDTAALESAALALGTAENMIRQEYLTRLHNGQVIPLPGQDADIKPGRNIGLLEITDFVFDEKEDVLDKMSNMFSAICPGQIETVFLLLENRILPEEELCRLYMGVCCRDWTDVSTSTTMLKSAVEGSFPGCRFQNVDCEKTGALLSGLFHAQEGDPLSVAAVSTDACPDWQSGRAYVQGMEKFVDGMRGKPYVLALVAEPIPTQELQRMQRGYASLYTSLSPLRTISLTRTEGTSVTDITSWSSQINSSVSVSTGRQKGSSTAYTTGKTTSRSKEEQNLAGSLMEAGFALGGALLGKGGGAFLGASLGRAARSAAGMAPVQVNEGENSGTTISVNEGETEQETRQNGKTDISGGGQNTSTSDSLGMQYTTENREVSLLLQELDRWNDRLEACQVHTAFRCAAYVLSGMEEDATTGANLYRSLVTGPNAHRGISCVNVWSKSEDVKRICGYLTRMLHPRFRLLDAGCLQDVDPATLVSFREMPLHFFWPRKSVAGVSVSHHAEFARTVSLPGGHGERRSVELGRVFHLGRTENNRVRLATDALVSHMCVAGAARSGKSNFCYQLLRRLREQDVRFLVIEPAKGQYAQVFGGLEDVFCYGANPLKGELLSINPFAFPTGVGALEHVESICSIFGTCWPLYAAMPDLLKDAILRSYQRAGWDMEYGIPLDDEARFPTFADVLDILPVLIENAGYSKEVTDNYKGSLLTRVRSMTNGINRLIFCTPELGDERLFNQNAIVDISRIPSPETQALIMGFLVTRLAEFRRSEDQGMDLPLRHVTVLEEAHNLLNDSHSGPAAGEGTSISGKSVELLVRAIAEMGTYGEGFLVVDQTPSALADAVISNTGTKVIFSLPNRNDCHPMSMAASLSDEQEREAANLPQGVCAIRNRDWSDPVLVKVDYFPHEEFCPPQEKPEQTPDRGRRSRNGALELLCALREKQEISPETCRSVSEALTREHGQRCRKLAAVLDGLAEGTVPSWEVLCPAVLEATEAQEWFRQPEKDLTPWDREMRWELKRRRVTGKAAQNYVLEMALQVYGKGRDKQLYWCWAAKLGRFSEQ